MEQIHSSLFLETSSWDSSSTLDEVLQRYGQQKSTGGGDRRPYYVLTKDEVVAAIRDLEASNKAWKRRFYQASLLLLVVLLTMLLLLACGGCCTFLGRTSTGTVVTWKMTAPAAAPQQQAQAQAQEHNVFNTTPSSKAGTVVVPGTTGTESSTAYQLPVFQAIIQQNDERHEESSSPQEEEEEASPLEQRRRGLISDEAYDRRCQAWIMSPDLDLDYYEMLIGIVPLCVDEYCQGRGCPCLCFGSHQGIIPTDFVVPDDFVAQHPFDPYAPFYSEEEEEADFGPIPTSSPSLSSEPSTSAIPTSQPTEAPPVPKPTKRPRPTSSDRTKKNLNVNHMP